MPAPSWTCKPDASGRTEAGPLESLRPSDLPVLSGSRHGRLLGGAPDSVVCRPHRADLRGRAGTLALSGRALRPDDSLRYLGRAELAIPPRPPARRWAPAARAASASISNSCVRIWACSKLGVGIMCQRCSPTRVGFALRSRASSAGALKARAPRYRRDMRPDSERTQREERYCTQNVDCSRARSQRPMSGLIHKRRL